MTTMKDALKTALKILHDGGAAALDNAITSQLLPPEVAKVVERAITNEMLKCGLACKEMQSALTATFAPVSVAAYAILRELNKQIEAEVETEAETNFKRIGAPAATVVGNLRNVYMRKIHSLEAEARRIAEKAKDPLSIGARDDLDMIRKEIAMLQSRVIRLQTLEPKSHF